MSFAVRHDEKGHKFVAAIDGQEAEIRYEAEPDGTCNLAHTFVPPSLRGHGVAEELARQTLDQLRATGLKYRLTCPFLRAFVQRHPEYREGTAATDPARSS
jgi:predicted GNAT family acetyltransferase